MPFHEAFVIFMQNFHWVLLLPRVAFYLTAKLRRVYKAYSIFERELLATIAHRRALKATAHAVSTSSSSTQSGNGEQKSPSNLMSLLLNSASDPELGLSEKQLNKDARKQGVVSLTDREILANCFIFYLAGHETTAGVLNFALGELEETVRRSHPYLWRSTSHI